MKLLFDLLLALLGSAMLITAVVALGLVLSDILNLRKKGTK